MDRIQELLAQLAELTADELAELDTLIGEEADRLAAEEPTGDVIAALNQLGDAADAHRGEVTRRDEESAALNAQREQALARLRPVATETSTEDEDAGGEETGDEAEEEAPAEQPQAVAASARGTAVARRPSPARMAGRGTPSAPRPVQSRMTAGRWDGGAVANRRDLVTAFSERLRQTQGAGDGRFSAVTIQADFPTERVLGTSQAQNEALIASALDGAFEPAALTAAGGLCAPIENLYDVGVVGSPARPVRGSLPSFGADRGGVSLRPNVLFRDFNDATGVWTMQNDIDAVTSGSPDPTKGYATAVCSAFEDYVVDGVYMQVKFQNVTSRFDPEMTAANLAAMDILHARFAENRLLTQLASYMTPVTSPKVLGAARDLLAGFDRLIAWFKSRHRLDDNFRLNAIGPRWVKDMLRADICRGETTLDALAAADAMIQDWFARRNVNITWHLDGRASAQSSSSGVPAIAAQTYPALTPAAVIPEFPDQVEWLVYVPGDFLFLDGGQIDLGTVRDSSLNATNSYMTFKETFEQVAWRGVEAVQYVATVDPTGMSAGRLDTSAISD